MTLIPRRVKYRKQQRGRRKGVAKGGTEIAFGRYGLQALGNAWISQRQIEACRLTLTRFIKKGGKIWINLVADKPISKKPAETRMGKGKGDTAYWAAVVRRGRVLFEIEGVSPQDAREALRTAGHKLPIRTQMIEREGVAHG